MSLEILHAANWCPPVALPSMIAVYPDSCSQDARVDVGTVCTFFCPHGLSLVGNGTAMMCLIDGQWDRQIEKESMTCQGKGFFSFDSLLIKKKYDLVTIIFEIWMTELL